MTSGIKNCSKRSGMTSGIKNCSKRKQDLYEKFFKTRM